MAAPLIPLLPLPTLLLILLLKPLTTLSLNQEGLYLHHFKLSLSDPTGVLSNWNLRDDTPCNWTGVTCHPLTHSITSLNLSSASLTGPLLPTFLCRLRSLSILSLPNNSINSSLLPSISNCQNLTHLDLSLNYLVGPIPSTLADIPNLAYLNLDRNSISGPIPDTFGTFRRLETLILTGNYLNGTIPTVISNITTLRVLDLAYNPFSPSRIAPELGNLTNLDYLWLSGCNLIGQIPDSFDRLSRLTNLEVSYNHLSGPIPSVIFRLPSIVQVELFSNSFTGELPTHWSNITTLRRFDASLNELTGTIPNELCELLLGSLGLYGNQLLGTLPESIAQSPNLFEIRLFDNQFTGSLPSQLGLNSPLETIDVSYNNFSGEIPPYLCRKGVLSELLLISNLFTGEIQENLARCRSLERVRLTSNRLYGEVPADFWGLPHVYLLDIADNSFSGNISSMISGASNVSTLEIWKNRFSGTIPNEVGSLVKLQKLMASDNKFSGQIPDTLTQLHQLEKLDLSNNDLVGGIPARIESMKQLNELNLAKNELTGEIPGEIGNLPVLNYLDLSNNMFTGRIPVGLQNLKLNMLNLSNNGFTGKIPAVFDNKVYRDSFLDNPGLCGDLLGLCGGKSGGKHRNNLWILGMIFIAAGVVGVAWFGLRYWKFKKTKKGGGATIAKWRSFHKLGFSEHEILDCLNEDNVIGSGSSGKVYKASLSNGEVVAVKKLWERSATDDDTSLTSVSFEKDGFDSEVETLGKIRHKNIVRLWCCCHARNAKLLVYEYMPNGSLGDLLHSSKGGLLDWPTRIRIALDVAEGLSYLHHDCVPPIVHRDVKSNNILLDGEFGARIADFGVAKIIEAVNIKGPESMSAIAGSCGYIAPEYAYTLRVNEKSDIYSFGVVILELVTGRRPIDQKFREKDLASWVSTTVEQKGRDHVLDTKLDSCFGEQICRVLDIGLLCISPLPINRPSMRRVAKMLQEVGAVDKPKITTKDGKLPPYYFEDGSDQGTLV